MPCEYIEDLRIPYFCVSANCTTARAVYHHTGSLWKYVRASMTILGLFPPVWDNGQLLVDGGYMDNLPVLYLRRILGPRSRIIAVDVENKDSSAFESLTPYDDGLSGFYLFFRRFMTFAFDATPFNHPAQGNLTHQLLYAQHIVQLEQGLRTNAIDIYIRPPFLNRIWVADYHKVRQMERRGYLTAKEVLDEYFEASPKKGSNSPNARRVSEYVRSATIDSDSSSKSPRRGVTVTGFRHGVGTASVSNLADLSMMQRKRLDPPIRVATMEP